VEKDLLLIDKLLSKIKVISNTNNQPVTIMGSCAALRCIGVGTDAAVFQCEHYPALAFKLYAEQKRSKIEKEAKVYQALKGSPYFSTCYAVTDRYLVLSFESGVTLYDCILQGITIPAQVMKDVEKAREFAREQGLNPRDIHFKNILLQNGSAKVIDVSEYLEPGNDLRFEHLKMAYDQYYHLIKGKAVPVWIVETIRKWYNQRSIVSIDDFMKTVLRLKLFVNDGKEFQKTNRINGK
jgi:predicted Ser/Thr protein kinase